MNHKYTTLEYRVPKVKINEDMMKNICLSFAAACELRSNPVVEVHGFDEGDYWKFAFHIPDWWIRQYGEWYGEFRKRMERLAEPEANVDLGAVFLN